MAEYLMQLRLDLIEFSRYLRGQGKELRPVMFSLDLQMKGVWVTSLLKLIHFES